MERRVRVGVRHYGRQMLATDETDIWLGFILHIDIKQVQALIRTTRLCGTTTRLTISNEQRMESRWRVLSRTYRATVE
jgi:hypothetical protein